MLVNQYHANIFPLLGEVLERLFDCRRFGFGVNDEKVALRVWGFGYMLINEY